MRASDVLLSADRRSHGVTNMNDASILRYIAKTYPDADIFTAGSGTFISCDAEKHWPNFATLVTSDEYDLASKLDRPGVYLNPSEATFDKVVRPLLDESHERVARARRKVADKQSRS
jgi:hypothetical protein